MPSARSSPLTSATRTCTTTAPTPLRTAHSRVHRQALEAARQAVIAMRGSDEIGDDAFHEIEEELDWLEMADGNKGK